MKSISLIDRALENARARLLAERDARGCWEGGLSSSALATAVAVCALASVDARAHDAAITRGLAWLARHANADGGWGDTTGSPSNLPTTLLGWAALNVAPGTHHEHAIAAEGWIARTAGSTAPGDISRAVAAAYGQDLTFTAPLLALLALMRRLGPEPTCWRLVAQLPLELLALPPRLWPWLRLGVVSYGLPALITIGLVRHRRLPGEWPLRRLRDALTPRALHVLEAMWPQGGEPDRGRSVGGYNEAPPLIGFVALGLAGAGLGDHAVAQRCVRYLRDWQRDDGSWSVEADLRGWLSTLSVAALGAEGRPLPDADSTRAWLLAAQRRQRDPTTQATPGGWAWNDLPGAMPDGDDTSAALLALHQLGADHAATCSAACAGLTWLCSIQNSDGGIPTFCRGWGKLPFDRSCPDLTAHALRAWSVWREAAPPDLRRRIDAAAARAERWLLRAQREDGAWEPLWFGNQAAPRQANPLYGTAQVVLAMRARPETEAVSAALTRGIAWLATAQHADGGWGGDRGVIPSIEETALASAALAGTTRQAEAERGAAWLVARTADGTTFQAAPLGLYFAQLWYSERLYPLVWTVLALGRVRAAVRMKEK